MTDFKTQEEIWKQIPELPILSVSDLGHVAYTDGLSKRPTLYFNHSGNYIFSITYNKKVYTKQLNRLVYKLFINPDLTNRMIVYSVDFNKLNCSVDNLTAISRVEALRLYNSNPDYKAYCKTGAPKSKGERIVFRPTSDQLSIIESMLADGSYSLRSIATMFKTTPATIRRLKKQFGY